MAIRSHVRDYGAGTEFVDAREGEALASTTSCRLQVREGERAENQITSKNTKSP